MVSAAPSALPPPRNGELGLVECRLEIFCFNHRENWAKNFFLSQTRFWIDVGKNGRWNKESMRFVDDALERKGRAFAFSD